MKFKITDLILIVILIVLIGIFTYFLFTYEHSSDDENNYALITYKEETVIELNYLEYKDEEYLYLLIENDKCIISDKINYSMIIVYSEKGIRVLESNCYDHTCMKMGLITSVKDGPIVCLPNFVTIQIYNEEVTVLE